MLPGAVWLSSENLDCLKFQSFRDRFRKRSDGDAEVRDLVERVGWMGGEMMIY